MSVIDNSLLLTAPAGGGGYQIQRSLRFNSADSAHLSRTPGSAGNRKTWTWAGWVKRSGLAGNHAIFGEWNSSGVQGVALQFLSTDKIRLYDFATSSADWSVDTAQVFRDTSAWYHLVFSLDTTQATASNRVKIYVNGSQATLESPTYPSQNLDTRFNRAQATAIGRGGAWDNYYFPGYLADVHFIDGQALDPSSFTETDATTGQLIPKAYSGSYGSNGWKLSFSDNSTAAALGTDTSNNNNNWTPNNFLASSGNIVSYTVTNTSTAFNAFDGNLSTAWFPNANSSSLLTFATPVTGTSFRLYMGASLNTTNFQINGSAPSGFSGSKNEQWYDFSSHIGSTLSSIQLSYVPGQYSQYVYAIEVDGAILYDIRRAAGVDSLTDTPTSFGAPDTGVGGEVRGNYATLNPLVKTSTTTLANGNLDVTSSGQLNAVSTVVPSTGKWYWEITLGTIVTNSFIGLYGTTPLNDAYLAHGINGYGFLSTGFGSASSTVSGTGVAGDVIGLAFDVDAKTLQYYKNGSSIGTISGFTFPGNWSLGISCNATVASPWVFNFGQRAFSYTAPSGYKCLVDTNLPAPTISKPSTVMDVKLWTGTGSTQNITGLGFSPDLVWIKSRSNESTHALLDTVRGASLVINSNLTNPEANNTSVFTSFNSDGFTLGADTSNGWTNYSGWSYAGWTWDAGTSTVTNTSGSISAQVRANATAGFSVVTFPMGSGSYTVGHGLGVAPSLIITKARSSSSSWWTYHQSLGTGQYVALNSTAAAASNYSWGSAPTSTVFTANNNFFTDGLTYVVYCFAPVAGYSSFGSYVGNGSSDGPMVWTGFRPRFLLVRSTGSPRQWGMFDTARFNFNGPNMPTLYANGSDAETTNAENYGDFLSNGFKPRYFNGNWNGSGETYIYACFAESPFPYSRAR
jgi:hypothetical protein